MSDGPLDMLVVHDIPDGTFAIADALQGVRIVQHGFKNRVEAEKFIEDYYLAGGIIARVLPTSIDCAKGAITGGTAFRNAGDSRKGKCCLNHLL